MEIEVDILEFKVPLENNKTIFIWDIQPIFSEAYIYEYLWKVFSAFGALYLLKVCPNAKVAEPGFYAMVKFYSSVHASNAQKSIDRKCLFQSSPVKVRLSSKQNLAFYSSKPLSLSKCLDLANHYLGFGGWSTHIITFKDLSKCVDAGCQQETVEGVLLKYGCITELSFPHHGVSCRGVGVAEDVLDDDLDPEERVRKRGTLMKRAKDNGVMNAFEKVLLLVLGNGKVAIEIKTDPDEVLPEENSEGVIQVNDISWKQFERASDEDAEDDFPWDLTEHFPQ
ncbi:hypothetical protein DNTS_031528 [Danionella cerebrum]|uniref:RAD52 motif-containing protein 1 n=1 Tax=Danionella cerebrum TaxID=2873325 RepID=A0A553R2R7_9TELE|nr:hypothetical protein DNTS_031528 [Danionella translucida]